LKTFGFVTYASMGTWHAAVTKGLTIKTIIEAFYIVSTNPA